MKRMKKIVSLLLAVIMAFAMTTTAFAADDEKYTITVETNKDDKADHTYAAYQIFKGDLKVEGNGKKLSNIDWGTGIDSTKIENLLDALKAVTDWETKEVNEKGEEVTLSFANCETAADVAAKIAKFASSDANTSKDIDRFATIISGFLTKETVPTSKKVGDAVQIEVIGAGYYMVMDNEKLFEQAKNENGDPIFDDNNDPVMVPIADSAYTRLLMQVVGDATVKVKSTVPSGEKKVFYQGKAAYDNDGKFVPPAYDNPNYQDANYAGIGDHASYRITSKVPNYVGYDHYFFVMKDKLSEGLDFDGVESVNVTIKVNGTEMPLTRGELKEGVATPGDADYYVYPDKDGYTFKLAFRDIMEKEGENYKWPVGSEIIVTYSATVNEKAIIGVEGNENAWSLDYSRDPNFEYDGKEDGTFPGLPNDEAKDVMGETPEDKTLTYLTELDIVKYADEIDSDDLTAHLLGGATFSLTGTSYQVVLKDVEYFKAVSEASADELAAAGNDRYYKLLETDAKTGKALYTTTAPVGDSWIKVGFGTSTTKVGYIKNSEGHYVVPENIEDYDGQDLYKHVKGTAEKYADAFTQYIKVKATESTRVETQVSIEETTPSEGANKGKIFFKGLGEGHYVLKETGTPEGYNTLDPIEIDISFTAPEGEVTGGNEKCTWTMRWTQDGVTKEFSSKPGEGFESGIFAQNVINHSGSLLPSTGGIGTTIFYVVGGILVIGAGILLVAKKRMSAGK